ncbi:hypothetical protein LXL04_018727 [Taraxacum kok-saghyz]
MERRLLVKGESKGQSQGELLSGKQRAIDCCSRLADRYEKRPNGIRRIITWPKPISYTSYIGRRNRLQEAEEENGEEKEIDCLYQFPILTTFTVSVNGAEAEEEKGRKKRLQEEEIDYRKKKSKHITNRQSKEITESKHITNRLQEEEIEAHNSK